MNFGGNATAEVKRVRICFVWRQLCDRTVAWGEQL